MSEPRVYNFALTEADVHCVFNALGKLPLEAVLSTFDSLRAQAVDQDRRAAQAAQAQAASAETPAEAPAE